MKAPYAALKKEVSKRGYGPGCHPLLLELCESAAASLGTCDRLPLVSKVKGKENFSFVRNSHKSRPVNASLFDDRAGVATQVLAKLLNGDRISEAAEINQAIYTMAMACCAAWDVVSPSDRKTQGTIFEWLCAALMQSRLGVAPEKSQPVQNLDLETNLPTDFVFTLGPEKPRLHLPVKTSTRERIIQVWAHQRVLDGVYGVGRFLAMPIIMTETKLDSKKLEVVEICLPWQWRLYQMHIACLWNVFYLDPPAPYLELDRRFPRVGVTTLGEGLKTGGRLDCLLSPLTDCGT